MDVLDKFKATQREGWAHFAPLQAMTTEPAARLVKFAGIKPGQRVLDVACGTGVVAVTAARHGADVTALDLTPELLSVARDNAQIAEVAVSWHEGDVEALRQALERLLEDASLRRQLSEQGRARVLALYTQQRIAADTVEAYQTAAPLPPIIIASVTMNEGTRQMAVHTPLKRPMRIRSKTERRSAL